MRVETISYCRDRGWSASLPPWDSPSTMVLAFCAPEFFDDPDALGQLADAYPNSIVAGCSTSGEIHGSTVDDDSLAVAIVRFDSTPIRLAVADIGAGDSRLVGETLAAVLDAPDLAGVLVLSDGLSVNGSDLAAGLNDVLSTTVPVTGGLAGDGDRFDRTWVLVDGKPQQEQGHRNRVLRRQRPRRSRVERRLGHLRSRAGGNAFGRERPVRTRRTARACAVQEVPRRPGVRPARQPLCCSRWRCGRPDDDKQLVRTILSVDETHQSLTFAGDIPQGHRGPADAGELRQGHRRRRKCCQARPCCSRSGQRRTCRSPSAA